MSVVSKLQIKPGQHVALLSLPMGIELDVERDQIVDDPAESDAVLLFVTTVAELGSAATDALVEAAQRDALAWVAYPKGGKLGTDLNRDSLAAALSERGVRAVRQIAIDDTWSALRFRPGE